MLERTCETDTDNLRKLKLNFFEFEKTLGALLVQKGGAKMQGIKGTGHTSHYLYGTWASMLKRCNNPNHRHYARYGGRGIRVCSRWMCFQSFAQDMGERGEGLTLDRINNDGNYEPSNCRWASKKQQIENRKVGTYFFEGEKYRLKDLVKLTGLTPKTFRYWVKMKGLSVKEVLEIFNAKKAS